MILVFYLSYVYLLVIPAMNNRNGRNLSDTDDENVLDQLRKLSVENFFFIEIFGIVAPVSTNQNHKRRGTIVSSFASSIVNNFATRPSWIVLR